MYIISVEYTIIWKEPLGLPAVIPSRGILGNKNLAFFKGCFLFYEKKLESKLSIFFHKKENRSYASVFIAERMGFEPTMQLPTYKLSRLAPSTTRTPLYWDCKEQQIFSVKKVSLAICYCISPRKDVSKIVLKTDGATFCPRRYINLVIAASVVMSFPEITPIFLSCVLVSY